MRNIVLTLILTTSILVSCNGKPTQTGFTEEAALEFLYQYMPLSDSVDYTEDYFRECVQYAFRAKEELPWGSNIPDREFKHFVDISLL